MQAELYSKPNCVFCTKAKMLLDQREIPYLLHDAVALRESLIERVTNDTGNAPKTLPQIYIDGRHIGGYTELAAFLA